MPKRTLAPMLNTATSIGAMSRSIVSTSDDHLLFLARVAAEAVRLAALGADLLDQRRSLSALRRVHAGDVAFAREAPRDGAAGGVAGADDQDCLSICHVLPSQRSDGATSVSTACCAIDFITPLSNFPVGAAGKVARKQISLGIL